MENKDLERAKENFKIRGKIIEEETGKGISNLTVKAIDKDLFFDDLLGEVTTDENGNFEINFKKFNKGSYVASTQDPIPPAPMIKRISEIFFDKKPDIYLKIKNPEGEVIHTTKDKVRYNASEMEEFNIKISKNKIKNLNKTNEVKKMENDDLERAKKIMNEFDPALVAIAVQEMSTKAQEIEKDDVEKAKVGIKKVYDSLPETKDRVQIISKAAEEIDADVISTEIKNVKSKLVGFDETTIIKAAKDLEIGWKSCLKYGIISPRTCFLYPIKIGPGTCFPHIHTCEREEGCIMFLAENKTCDSVRTPRWDDGILTNPADVIAMISKEVLKGMLTQQQVLDIIAKGTVESVHMRRGLVKMVKEMKDNREI